VRFTRTPLPGAYVIDLEAHEDDRGYFARAFCAREFGAHGIPMVVAQANLSHNAQSGTLRGLHYQVPPAAEAKLIRCLRGALYDVIVDVRPDSRTYLEWFGAELTADNGRAMYVPEGFAHGLVTLEDDTLAHYQASAFYSPAAERGIRYDDPALGITWPHPVRAISDKDRNWPLLDTEADG
jgi:dTDP-4-dehydrorhamnose 3,5-epimerase